MSFYSAKQSDSDKTALLCIENGLVMFVSREKIEERDAAVMAYRAQDFAWNKGVFPRKFISLVIPWRVEPVHASASEVTRREMLKMMEEGQTRYVWSDEQVLGRAYTDEEVLAS